MIKKFQYKDITLETLEMDNKSKKNIFIIHGITADFNNLNCITEKFKNEFNIFSINLPSHGKSDSSEKYSSPEVYEDVLIDYIKEKKLENIYLIGHSMGGALAMNISAKLKNKIIKIALISPLNFTTMEILEKLAYAFSGKTLLSKLIFLKYSYHNPLRAAFNKKWKASTQKWIDEHKKDFPIYEKLGRKLNEKEYLLKIEKNIKNCTKPIGLFYGSSDNIVNNKKIANYFLKNNEDVQVFKIPKCGHNPWRENESGILKALAEFLKD